MTHMKTVLEMHPLYRRLSGQVIWLLFEEREAPEARINAFLERYEAQKRRNLELMAQAMSGGGGSGPSHLLFCLDREHDVCGPCRALAGKAMPLGSPDMARWFPPFGLGCAISPGLLSLADHEDLNPAPVDAAVPPEPGLVCGEWVFSHPWESGG
jgi:hypothetical protein